MLIWDLGQDDWGGGSFPGNTSGDVEAANSDQSVSEWEASYRNSSSQTNGEWKKITLVGASGNNLQHVTVDFPIGTLICVTGVSGSGKSTLINDTLYPILSQHFYRSLTEPLPYESIENISCVDKVVNVDQSPLGRTPRSNPATYTGVFLISELCS